MAEAASSLIEGETGAWEVVLGLEIHAQVASKAKLFSGAAVGFGGGPNEQVSFVDAAMPGMLPVINRRCVEQAVRTGLGLGARINLWSRFDRKNYFYPDLPQGYQISQYKDPIVGEGAVSVERDDGSVFTVRIERLHLEQDAGKSIHDLDPSATFVDLNRAGTALMEIVSYPDMRSAEEAAAYVKKVRAILRYLGTCDGDMEKGNLRADVNVSMRRPGGPLGTRCEIKNVNSYRYIQQAIGYEAHRQIAVLEAGGAIRQETRLFDPGRGETRSMRSKEEAQDYRYFPIPTCRRWNSIPNGSRRSRRRCRNCPMPSVRAWRPSMACPSTTLASWPSSRRGRTISRKPPLAATPSWWPTGRRTSFWRALPRPAWKSAKARYRPGM